VRDLLHICGLTVKLPTAEGWVRPVNDLSLRVRAGECLGLVGESGSGKTMLSLALMGLLPEGARIEGHAWFHRAPSPGDRASPNGRKDLTRLSEAEFRATRGREIAMIFQEPMTSLNPVMRVGAQVEEAIRAHERRIPGEQARKRTLEALELASVPEPARRARQFPHQLSGGLRQRVMIAMALAAGRPSGEARLLIADEPTTALDVTVQREILELLGRLRRELGLGLLFITHDLGVVRLVADRVAVMYAGRIVEEGPAESVLREPSHPYTAGLLAASPKLERGKLRPIEGNVPRLTALPPGCAFEPRCPLRREECGSRVPELRAASPEHSARCVLVGNRDG
jgi:oligopeptide/dipeptide ABC transporter ATP-binding protein